jgi:hypothetical protein
MGYQWKEGPMSGGKRRGVNHIIGRIADIGSPPGDPDVTAFAPTVPPGIPHDPGIVGIIPAHQHHGVVDPATAIAFFVYTEHSSPVALHVGAGADRHGHRSITIDGILYRLRGRGAGIVPHITPVSYPVRMVELPITGLGGGRVGKVGFQHGSGLRLVDGCFGMMVFMGPPPPVATVSVGVAGKQKLFREVRGQAAFPLQVGLERPDRAEGPAAPAIPLVPDRGDDPGIPPVKRGGEPKVRGARRKPFPDCRFGGGSRQRLRVAQIGDQGDLGRPEDDFYFRDPGFNPGTPVKKPNGGFNFIASSP